MVNPKNQHLQSCKARKRLNIRQSVVGQVQLVNIPEPLQPFQRFDARAAAVKAVELLRSGYVVVLDGLLHALVERLVGEPVIREQRRRNVNGLFVEVKRIISTGVQCKQEHGYPYADKKWILVH